MSEIMKVQGIARSIHYKYSWQWIEGGLRIMSTAVWDDFSKEINETQDMLDKAVRGVVKRYDELMDNAKRRLGKKLFHIEEFPTKEELRDRFKILIRTYPVPDKEDFRADIPEDVIENFEDNTKEQYQKAVNEMWGRFRSVLEHAFEQLSKKEGKLFESVVENIKSLTELLPRLNIVEDAKLNELVEMANNAFENVTIEQLRENTGKRKRKARAAKEILDKMADYLGG
jgi:predicted transcriptional regulator